MMNRRTVLAALSAAVLLLAIAQVTAIRLYNYHEIEWFYTPSHILGGVCVALFFGYMAIGLRWQFNLPVSLVIVLMVGISWEIFEYLEHMQMPNWDTASDLVADVLGGFVGWRIIKHISSL